MMMRLCVFCARGGDERSRIQLANRDGALGFGVPARLAQSLIW